MAYEEDEKFVNYIDEKIQETEKENPSILGLLIRT